MISSKLNIALHEAVQAHAQRYSQGKLDLGTVLLAIAELAASYLAEVPHGCERRRLFSQLCLGIAVATSGKTPPHRVEDPIRS
jgi:hypothetical protein